MTTKEQNQPTVPSGGRRQFRYNATNGVGIDIIFTSTPTPTAAVASSSSSSSNQGLPVVISDDRNHDDQVGQVLLENTNGQNDNNEAVINNGDELCFSLVNFSGQIRLRRVLTDSQSTEATTIPTTSFNQLATTTTTSEPNNSLSVTSDRKTHRNIFSSSTERWLNQVLEGGDDERLDQDLTQANGSISSSLIRSLNQSASQEIQKQNLNHSQAQQVDYDEQSNEFVLHEKQQQQEEPSQDNATHSVVGGGASRQRLPQHRQSRHLRRKTIMSHSQQSMRDLLQIDETDRAVVVPQSIPERSTSSVASLTRSSPNDELVEATATEAVTETATVVVAPSKTTNFNDSDYNSSVDINGNVGQRADEQQSAIISLDILQAVTSSNLTVDQLEGLIANGPPEAVKAVDGKGRTPLHLLGCNSDLLSDIDGQIIARQCAILLMELHPEAITQEDDDGRVPFVLLLEKWVEWTHEEHGKSIRGAAVTSKNRKPCRLVEGDTEKSWRSRVQQLFKPNQMFQSEVSRKRSDSAIQRQDSRINSKGSSLYASSNRFPPVIIFEEVEWCFEMLSIAMDHLGGAPLEGTQQIRPPLSYRKRRIDRATLATKVASIPQLLKTTMLLESNETRNKILESPIIRRSLFCPVIIGQWLTSMLRYSKGTASKTSVEFLLILSTLSVEDFAGSYRKPGPRDEEEFKEAKMAMFDAVNDLKDLTPSLLVLPDALWDHALATPLIWYCMNREVTTPFAVGIATSDFQLIVTTIVAVREAVFGYTTEEGQSTVFPFLNIIAVVFFTCLYSVFRRICQFYALFRISSTVAWRYFLDPWHLLDFVAVFSAMFASARYAKAIEDPNIQDDRSVPTFLYAIMLGLLWLRILSFLKAVNERLATFILALTRIFFDIRYFCAVLLVVVLLFGDVFHLLFTGDNYAACNADEANSAADDFCADDVIDSYLRVYTIIVGDFDLSDFRQTPAITIVWFLVTFIGLVVLLNTLIAIISVSYEASHVSSKLLFRRARCIFVAGNAAVEGFLQPRFFYSQSSSSRKIDCMILFTAAIRWILILTFVLTIGYSSVYIASRITVAIQESNILSLIALIFLSFVVLYVFWAAIVIFVSIFARMCYGQQADKSRLKHFISVIDDRLVDFIATYMFGVDTVGDGGDPLEIGDRGNDAVIEKLSQLEKTIELLIEQQKNNDLDGAVSVSLPPKSD